MDFVSPKLENHAMKVAPTQDQILDALRAKKNAIGARELSEELGITRIAAKCALWRLGEKGLAQRIGGNRGTGFRWQAVRDGVVAKPPKHVVITRVELPA